MKYAILRDGRYRCMLHGMMYVHVLRFVSFCWSYL